MKRPLKIARWAALAALALGPLGCTVTTRSHPVVVEGEGVLYADVDAAPIQIDIATYPQTYYGGHAFYFYQDQWYYQDRGRWAYYRVEPEELHRQRSYVQQAPRAEPRVQRAPPVERRPEQASPAERHVDRAPPARQPAEEARPTRRASPQVPRSAPQQAPAPRSRGHH